MQDMCLCPGQAVLPAQDQVQSPSGPVFLGKQRESRSPRPRLQKSVFSSHGRDVTAWCLHPVSAERMILLGSLPPEILGALHIILAARHIILAVSCSYLFCTSLYLSLFQGQSSCLGDQGRQLPAVTARLLHHHVQKAGGLEVGYLGGKYLVDKCFRAIN